MIDALLKLVKYQEKEIKAKQTAIDYLTKEVEELQNELYELKVREVTNER